MAYPKIGLALGGGGARGISHIPVLEAFDEYGIKPHAIAGTSIGAIFGGAYASGLSGRQIREIALASFADRNAVLSRLWKLRPRRFVELFNGNSVQFDPLKVLEVFVAEYLPASFEELEIPLRVLATDFYGGAEVDIESGALLSAIAASIAIPALFRPVMRQNQVLIDGGVINPLPFDRLPSDCDVVIAVDVVGAPVCRPGRSLPSSLDAIYGTSQILMQSITAQKLKQNQPDLLLRPDTGNIRVLDFMKAKEILDLSESLREKTLDYLRELSLDKNNN